LDREKYFVALTDRLDGTGGRLMDYQAKFNESFVEYDDEERYGRYGQLVFALQDVFEAAGCDITGDELARQQHSHIVGAIGQTDLATIARHFIGWVHVDSRPPYEVQSVAEAYLPHRLYDLGRDTRVSPDILDGWNQQILDAKKKQGIRGRKSRKYQDFIAGIAAIPNVRKQMLQTAQSLLDDRAGKLEKLREELAAENEKAMGHAAHLRRTAYIIEAFCEVTGVEDERGKAAALREIADRVERGANRRQETVQSLNGGPTAVEVIQAGLDISPDKKLIELKAVWAEITASDSTAKD